MKNNIKYKEKVIYMNHLISRIYKILPLSEENSNKLPKLYMERLIEDIISANELFDGILISIITQLNVLQIKEISHKKLKSIIFDCITMCKNIEDKLEEIKRSEDIGFNIL